MRMYFAFVFCALIAAVFADDGMWMPHQMKNLNLREKGLKMNPEDLYKTDGTGLMSAIVYLGGGTGEFVSSQGLILTNHHVAFGALQRAATPEMDYIEDGFLARSKEDEIPAPGYVADVLLGYEEITVQINSAINENMSYAERYQAIERRKKEIIQKAEGEASDLHCRIEDMYSGNQYFLYKFKRLPDVRIVYAPPRDLGNFGGDIDNWMWPRHTADFTFLRAYVSPENVGIDYSPKNVPYQPKSYLKISRTGVDDGEFTFVMGYPGRTYRNFTVSELKSDIHRMEKRIILYEKLIRFYEEAGKENKQVEIKYARKLRALNNSLKNYKGKLEGFEKNLIVKKRSQKEKELIAAVQKAGKDDALRALEALNIFVQRYDIFREEYEILNELVSPYFGSSLLAQAHLIVRAVQERQKPDLDREESFQNRNESRLRSRIELADRGYDLESDQKLLELFLNRIKSDSTAYELNILKNISSVNTSTIVAQLFDGTTITDTKNCLNYLDYSPGELTALNDPLLNLAMNIEEQLKTYRDLNDAKSQERQDLKRPYMKALYELNNHNLAADANGTIRFTYGNVEGYSPRDAVWYTPQTTLGGVIDKNTGQFPFRVPEKLHSLYQQRNFGSYKDSQLDNIPACFLNTTNVTGGNSGSPTLNAKGEQVGIIFDMTYESVIGDYFIIPEFQRTISVDILYVLFITDKFAGAGHVLEEMGIK